MSRWKNCADNKILTVFELFMVEILKELFRNLRFVSPSILLQQNQENDSMFQLRWLNNNLFAPSYSRTVTNKKAFTNCLRKAYNWLIIWILFLFHSGKCLVNGNNIYQRSHHSTLLTTNNSLSCCSSTDQ